MKADTIDQIGIACLGMVALLLINLGIMFGSVLGLAGQIFWFRTTKRHKQWGMFVLVCAYTIVWLIGATKWLMTVI
jgi:hypothetical protein